MISGRKLDKRLTIPGLALLALVVIGAEVASAQRATATRSSGGGSDASSGSSSPPSRSSSGTMSRSSSSTSGPRATSTSRATGGRAKPKAVDTRRSTPADRGRRSSGHHFRHRHDIGLYFGYGGHFGYGYRYGYYYPYYYHPFYWGVPYYVPRRAYSEYRLGAFDLNVRPKKSEVYLDGQFIGTAGQFDGFPDHLWLEQGSYELIFYSPGLGTERRVLSIYPGVVVDVRLRLQPGESIPPAELSSVDRERGAIAEVKSAYERQRREARAAAPPPARAELDTRAAPGRVRLSVVPADASVYLDGRLLGSGDELAKLHSGLVVEAGSHLLEVVRPGYATERREFAVEEGAEVELEVLLEAG